MLQIPELGGVPAIFEAFVARHRQGSAQDIHNIDLKHEHSWKVMDNAAAIAASLELSGAPRRLCLAAGLLHDFGRFPQYQQYKTFHDGKSENHARLGARHLRKEQACALLAPEERRLVQAAVILHNRMALPRGISPVLRCLAEVVRDADKLDIIRVMAAHFASSDADNPVVTLHVQDDPIRYTPAMLETILQGHPGRYADMRWTNDFKILLCGWVDQLYFSGSRTLLDEQGHIQVLLETLPVDAGMLRLRERVRQLLRTPMPEPACGQALRQWRG